MIDSIIFDAEGVIVDTEPIWDKSQETFLKRRNIDYHRDQIKHFLTGASLLEGTMILKKKYGITGDLNSLFLERKSLIENLFSDGVNYIEGFQTFLNKICCKFKIAIASSLDRDLLGLLCSQLKLDDFFKDRIFSISDINNISKPNPDIYLYTAKKMYSDTNKCMVIEDSPSGIKAAKHAGMFCVAITSTYSKEYLVGSDLIIDGYNDLMIDSLISINS